MIDTFGQPLDIVRHLVGIRPEVLFNPDEIPVRQDIGPLENHFVHLFALSRRTHGEDRDGVRGDDTFVFPGNHLRHGFPSRQRGRV